ncbi:unnamed protein product, partial [Urochloa humidicola]
ETLAPVLHPSPLTTPPPCLPRLRTTPGSPPALALPSRVTATGSDVRLWIWCLPSPSPSPASPAHPAAAPVGPHTKASVVVRVTPTPIRASGPHLQAPSASISVTPRGRWRQAVAEEKTKEASTNLGLLSSPLLSEEKAKGASTNLRTL